MQRFSRGLVGHCLVQLLVLLQVLQGWPGWSSSAAPAPSANAELRSSGTTQLGVFGPKDYIRGTGQPVVVTDSFNVAAPGGGYRLCITNGGLNGQYPRVSSAVVTLNDVDVVKTNEFNKNVATIKKQVTLLSHNVLRVEVRSEPGSGFTLQIGGGCLESHAPVADAGPDQTVKLAEIVQLDGSRSSDRDGDPLTYQWSFVSKPSGSTAALSDSRAVRPTFQADKAGQYVVQLQVSDLLAPGQHDDDCDANDHGEGCNRHLDQVVISTQNSKPVADAGPDRTTLVQQPVTLDGSKSSDVDGDPLTFKWTFASRPAGSSAVIQSATSVNPSFVPDGFGEYVVLLVVNDGSADSVADTVKISTVNSSPVANAGAHQTARVGSVIVLDGSGSTDLDGDPLTYSWSLLSKPSGSTATLQNAKSVNPSLVIDVPGDYVVQLIVNDGRADSDPPSTVTVSTRNSPPTADAGPDQVVVVGDTVRLNGSGSSDVDGNPLTFHWSLISKPQGSTASLSDPASVKPTFVFDRPGIYIAQLIVNDGIANSAPDSVIIASQNLRPVANAGPAQTVALGATVHLDGRASSDPNGDALRFFWSLLSKPDGSTTALSGATSSTPAFTADKRGTYVVQLVVNDGALDSAPANVVISTENSIPIAKARPDRNISTGSTVQLDGSGSVDPDGSSLLYFWSLLSKPDGSAAAISSASVVNPTFLADKPGLYVVQLIVGDGSLVSSPDTVTVTTSTVNQPPAITSANATTFTVGQAGTFTVTTTGFPTGASMVINETGALPSPVTFTDNHNGTATLAGTPAAATNGTSPITITANNGVAPNAVQNFTLTVNPANQAPAITSANATTFTVGSPGMFTVTTTGFPTGATMVISETGALPSPVTFTNNNNGTATLAGTPAAGTGGTYPITITANNGVAPNAVQNFTLTVSLANQAPAITSANGTTFTVGTAGSFTVTTTGAPTPSLIRGGVALPSGVTFVANANGTGTLSGTPVAGTAGTYALTFTAANGVSPNAVQNFTLTVNQSPAITSANATTFTVGVAGSFTVTTTGVPTPSLTRGGVALPSGVTFVANANGTGTLSGTPAAGTGGTYALTFTAANGVLPNAVQNFTLTVDQGNRAPTITSTAVITAQVGQPYSYDVDATDPDAGDALTYSLTTFPAGMTINGVTGVISWAPQANQTGPQNVTVQVSDGHPGGIASQSFTIQVAPLNPNNMAPRAQANSYIIRADQVLTVPAPGVLGNDSDPENDPLTARKLTDPTRGVLSFNADGSFSYTPSAANLTCTSPPPAPGISFTAPTSVLTFPLSQGGNAKVYGVARGDFNQDGFLDLVATGRTATNTNVIWLLLGKGDGSFQAPIVVQSFASGANGYVGILAKDVDGDCKLDLLVGLESPREVRFFKGRGDGTFEAPIVTALTQPGGSLQSGDFNGDGKLDLVSASSLQPFVSVLLGNGDGTFQAPIDYPVSQVVWDQAVGDLNGDRAPDIVVSRGASGSQAIDVLLNKNDGSGTFNTARQFPVNMTVGGFYLADFNRDGKLDIVAGGTLCKQANGGASPTGVAGCMRFIPGNGDGTFPVPPGTEADTTAMAHFATRGAGSENVAPDVNGDGIPDVIFGETSVNTGNMLHVRLGTGDGTFTGTAWVASPGPVAGGPQPTSAPTIDSLTSLAAAVVDDFNGDGVMDIATALTGGASPGRLALLPGTTPGQFASARVFPVLEPPFTLTEFGGGNVLATYPMTLGDFTNDGRAELAVLGAFNRVGVMPFAPDGTLGPVQTGIFTGSAQPAVQKILNADFDGDGNLDVVWIGNAGNGLPRLIVAYGNGAGQFTNPVFIAPTGNTQFYNIVVGDFNNDGFPDIAAYTGFFQGGPVTPVAIDIYLSTGGGRGFTLLSPAGGSSLGNVVTTTGVGMVAADFDQDGVLDLVVSQGLAAANLANQQRSLYLRGNGDGTFQPAVQIANGLQAGIIDYAAADINHDGKLDLVGLPIFGPAYVQLGNGNGTFGAPVGYDLGLGGADGQIALADFDGDGHLDIAATIGSNASGVSVLRGNGDGTFGAGQKLAVGTHQRSASSLIIADVNNDGRPDIIAGGPSFYAQDFTVLLNNSAKAAACTFSDSFTYAASDGSLDSPPTTVRITIQPVNHAPLITSAPVTSAATGQLYTYDVNASDPDAGDRLSFALATAPSGMSMDAITGLVQWRPAPTQAGPHPVTVRVYDSLGAFAEQSFTLTVIHRVTVPNVVGQTQAAAQTIITGAGLTVGTITSHYSPTVPAGNVISQSPLAGVSVADNSAVSLVVSLGPLVVPGLTSITVSPGNPAVLVGGTQTFTATGVLSGGGTVDVTDGVTWSSGTTSVATISALGVATGVAAGTSTITATLGSVSGNTTLTVRARVTGDTTLPIAAITTPADGAEVTSPIDVIGTATDANFFRYELSYALAGETDFTLVATGSSPITNGVLGQFDPTLLINDLYDLKLTVFDLGGNEASAIVTVQVARELKIGLFTITFQDLNIPLSGIPITINRTYDSRDKGKGDFGIGWRLGIQTLRIRPNREQGSGWVVNHSGGALGAFSLARVGEHKVSLTLPSGKVEEFDMAVNPSVSPLVPLQTVTASYIPRPGTLGSLISLADNDLVVVGDQPGDVTLVTFAGALTYNPKRFRYTTAAGQVIDIDRTNGVEKVQDLNGNTLTFGPTGIIHSSGKSVTFVRDAENRIAQITDPKGSSQSYAYDASGDLITHTDPLGNITRFSYNRTHGLLQIVDPLNRNAIRNEYDANGRLIVQTDAQGNRVTYTHNLNTQQEVITDRLGRSTVAEYDAVGNIVATSDALGNRSTATYDSEGNQLTSTNPLAQTTTLTYDARRNLLRRTDPLGNVTQFSYDTAGRLLTTTDPVGNTTTNTYDTRGNLLSTTDGAGGVRRFTYDAAGNALTAQDATGQTTQFTYSADGFATSATDPEGVTATFTRDGVGNLLTDTHTLTTQAGSSPVAWSYGYDAKGNATRITSPVSNTPIAVDWNAVGQIAGSTDPLGNQWQAQYDAVGNLSGRTIPGQPALQVGHDAEGQETSANLPGGGVLQRAFDPLGRAINITLPGLGQSTQSWDAASRKTSQADPLGNVTTFSYDVAGRRVSESKPGGAITTYGYDAAGRVTSITDPSGRVYQYAYDGVGRTTRTTLPDGTQRPVSYDGNGQIVSATGLFGDTWSYTYGPNGQVESVRDPAGNTTTYGHDSHSVIDRVTDAQGRISTFVHDALGRPVRRTLPGGQTSTCAYDPLGRRTHCTDFAGAATQFSYDDTARSFRRTAPDGTEQRFFNPDNQLARVVDSRGTTAFGRDSGNRLTSWIGPDGAAVQYSRDTAGRITAITTTAGTTTLTYNTRGELASVIDSGGTTSYTHDLAGRPTAVTFANGITLTNTYDTAGRIARITYISAANTTLLDLLYTRAPSGRISRVQESTGRDSTYSYDSLGHLTQERITPSSGPVETIIYAYDVSGNLTQRTDSTGTQVFTYDSNDRVLSDGTSTYTWDPNGNLTSRTSGATTEIYTYDGQNRLVRFARTGTSPSTIDYAYDVDGLLASRTVNAVQTRFVWDRVSSLFPQLLEERDATNALLRRYEHGEWALTHVRDSGGATSFFLSDHLGTVRATAATNGSVTAQFTYDAFGRPQGVSPSGIGYTNGYADPGTGLIFMRSRWYAPALARFIQTDGATADVRDPRTLNRYVYSVNDPVNHFDPMGQTTLLEVSNYIALLAIAFTIVGVEDIVFRSGGVSGVIASGFGLRNISEHLLESKRTAWIAPLAFSAGLGAAGAGFTAGLEFLRFDQLRTLAGFFYFGSQFTGPGQSLLSGQASLDPSPVFNTPTPGQYGGWFVSVSLSGGITRKLGSLPKGGSINGGVGAAGSIFWSPTPTYTVNDKTGDIVEKCPPTGACSDRYAFGFKAVPSGIGSASVSMSLTFYIELFEYNATKGLQLPSEVSAE